MAIVENVMSLHSIAVFKGLSGEASDSSSKVASRWSLATERRSSHRGIRPTRSMRSPAVMAMSTSAP